MAETLVVTANDSGALVQVALLTVDDPDLDVVDDNEVWMLLSCAVGEGLALYPW